MNQNWGRFRWLQHQTGCCSHLKSYNLTRASLSGLSQLNTHEHISWLLDSYLRPIKHFVRVSKWINWTVPSKSAKRSGERDTQPVPLAASSYWGTSSAAGTRGTPKTVPALTTHHWDHHIALRWQWTGRENSGNTDSHDGAAKPVQFHLHLSLSPTLCPLLKNWLSSCCGNTADWQSWK